MLGVPECQGTLMAAPSQGLGALGTPVGQTGVTSLSAPCPYLQHRHWERTRAGCPVLLTRASPLCPPVEGPYLIIIEQPKQVRTRPGQGQAERQGHTPVPWSDPLRASTAGLPISVWLRGAVTRRAARSVQREGAQDVPHRQGECWGERGFGVHAGTGRGAGKGGR